MSSLEEFTFLNSICNSFFFFLLSLFDNGDDIDVDVDDNDDIDTANDDEGVDCDGNGACPYSSLEKMCAATRKS